MPSSDTSRSPRHHAPGAPAGATNPATRQNSSRSGSAPSRDRALDSASSDGTATATPRSAQASTPASLRITLAAPRSMNNASASVKYSVSHAGIIRLRCSRFPAASMTSSTSSRGNARARTPTEIRSSRPPSASPACCPALATQASYTNVTLS